jgi:hypothetical protein
MSQITPTIYLSGYRFARNLDLLRGHGITHIINMCCEYSNFLPNNFQYLHITAEDSPSERLYPTFFNVAAFAAKAANEGGKCLIHCQQGISRSVTSALACLIINERMSLAAAFALVKGKHEIAEPNNTFLKELRRLENDVLGSWTREEITPLDACDEPQLDWVEGLAVVLANTRREGVSIEMECSVIDDWFVEGEAAGSKGYNRKVKAAILIGLSNHGLDNALAGESLKDLLQHSLLDCGRCSVTDYKKMLIAMETDAEFDTLQRTYPKAKSWLKTYISEIPPLN